MSLYVGVLELISLILCDYLLVYVVSIVLCVIVSYLGAVLIGYFVL